METSRKWYLYQNSKKYGPFSEKTFCAAIDRGKLKNDALVWRRGMKGYKRITEVEPFKSCFTKPHGKTIEKPIPPAKPSAVEAREHEDGQKMKKSNEWAMMSAVSATLGIICLYFWNLYKGLESEGISRSLTPIMFYFGIFLFITAIASGAFSLHLRRRGHTRWLKIKKRGKLLGSKKFKIVLLVLLIVVVVIVIFLVIDWDRDGLTTITEVHLGTNPFNSDTDGDGLKDGLEANTYHTNPLVTDTDGDGLNDYQEVNTYGTNPLVSDTDGDGLNDALEVNTYHTNPLISDTDGDGLNDGLEVNTYHTNPLVADTDGDGLNDGLEVNTYGTNPLVSDTDGDGLNDGLEVNTYHTNPLVIDTDGDGLNDYQEVNVYKTSPSASDSDGDGLKDGAEVNTYHTDPLAADTDNDGLNDGLEVNTLASNPLRMDIFVEVDWMVALDPSVISKLITEFAYAPIQNPNGTTGITLHIDLDQQVPAVSEINSYQQNGDLNDFYDYKEHYFSQRNGFHYALICECVKRGDEVEGGVAPGFDLMVATQSYGYLYPSDVIGSIFMHELGHTIGLQHGVYNGIDSYEVSFSIYQSVMNYNKPSDYYGYSSGGAFSDWNYLQEHGLNAPG